MGNFNNKLLFMLFIYIVKLYKSIKYQLQKSMMSRQFQSNFMNIITAVKFRLDYFGYFNYYSYLLTAYPNVNLISNHFVIKIAYQRVVNLRNTL